MKADMSTAIAWDESFDLVIVGSGGGSMCAALAAKRLGKHALIVEKQALVGGSTIEAAVRKTLG